MNRLINIVVVNWNGKELLPACLDALRNQVYKPLCITFVDNGSDDGSIDFVSQNYPEVEIISLPGNFGFSAANNIALRNVKTKYVALINNDAIPHIDWLKNLVEALENHSSAGCAASKILFYDNPKIIDRAGDSYTKAGAGLLRGRGKSSSNYRRQEYIFGACAGAALYRAEMFNDIGLFDEDFFLLYEDVDLSFRAQLKGYKCLYVPEAVVYHRASSSIVYDSSISVYYSHRNLEWTYIKNMPARLILKTILQHGIYDIASFFFFVVRGRGRDFVKSKMDALKGVKKMLKKRRRIQATRKVDDKYIWSLLNKELFIHRLTRRL